VPLGGKRSATGRSRTQPAMKPRATPAPPARHRPRPRFAPPGAGAAARSQSLRSALRRPPPRRPPVTKSSPAIRFGKSPGQQRSQAFRWTDAGCTGSGQSGDSSTQHELVLAGRSLTIPSAAQPSRRRGRCSCEVRAQSAVLPLTQSFAPGRCQRAGPVATSQQRGRARSPPGRGQAAPARPPTS